MEIIVEILVSLFSGLLQFAFEILAQLVFELLAELGVRCLAEPFRRPEPTHPLMAAMGYLIFGAIAGGVSLMLPKMFELPQSLKLANLVLTPIACGFAMALYGKLLSRRGNDTIRLDTFIYGYLFALAMASVRFIWR